MRKLSKSLSKGLTLIELLVVVAILGILAAVLLAAVDPIQQQLKATDAVAENTANEWIQANYRYYGGKTAYPWYPTPGCYAAGTTPALGPNGGATTPALPLPTLMNSSQVTSGTCISLLTGSGELKSSFSQVDPNILNKLYINQPAAPAAAATSLSVCYSPQSKTGQLANNAIYGQNGAPTITPGAVTTPGYYCAF